MLRMLVLASNWHSAHAVKQLQGVLACLWGKAANAAAAVSCNVPCHARHCMCKLRQVSCKFSSADIHPTAPAPGLVCYSST